MRLRSEEVVLKWSEFDVESVRRYPKSGNSAAFILRGQAHIENLYTPVVSFEADLDISPSHLEPINLNVVHRNNSLQPNFCR